MLTSAVGRELPLCTPELEHFLDGCNRPQAEVRDYGLFRTFSRICDVEFSPFQWDTALKRFRKRSTLCIDQTCSEYPDEPNSI